MWTKDNIYEELEQLSPLLATIPNTNVYAVKVGYFEGFAGSLNDRLNEGSTLLANKVGSKLPAYTVPEDYFQNFATNILSKIKAGEEQAVTEENELATIAPLLSNISRKNVYTVPFGYFENLTVKIPVRAAKIVAFTAVKSVYKLAVAAVFIAIMAIGAYLFLNKEDVRTTSSNPVLTADVSTLSEAEIIAYLKEQPNTEVTASNIIIPDNNFDVKAVIEDLTDEELQQFLIEFPESKQGKEG